LDLKVFFRDEERLFFRRCRERLLAALRLFREPFRGEGVLTLLLDRAETRLERDRTVLRDRLILRLRTEIFLRLKRLDDFRAEGRFLRFRERPRFGPNNPRNPLIKVSSSAISL